MSENIREIILDSLIALEEPGSKSHLYIRDVLNKYDYLDLKDKAFYKRVTEGCVSTRITLDYVLDLMSKKPMAKCKPVVRNVLRMSAYQILFMEKVPDSAACDEAVKLIRKRSFESFCPFVNGILRNLCKKKDTILNFDSIEDKALRLSIKYSCPEWIVKMFIKEQDDPEGILKGLLRIRPTCVRIINPSDKEALLLKWEKADIHFLKSEYIDDAYFIEGFEGIENVPGFLEGKLLVQDESSGLAAKAAGVDNKKDLLIIDTCAAPGGKTSYVASKMMPRGKVISCDVSDKKVDLIRENIERMKLTNVEARVADATVFNEDLENKADIVICDVPCSGLGVMARKTDIKYNISNEAMKDICDLQKEIVKNVSRYVKPGGVFVYSTCTIHKAENEKMVKFIEDNLPFKGDSLKAVIPELFKINRKCDYAIQLLPNVEGTDGFFVARFKKDL